MYTANHATRPVDPLTHREALLGLLEDIPTHPARPPDWVYAAPPMQFESSVVHNAFLGAVGYAWLAVRLLIEGVALTYLAAAIMRHGFALDTVAGPARVALEAGLLSYWTWRALALGAAFLPTELARHEDLLVALHRAHARGLRTFSADL